jgi:tetraacyldisaccharide 4'-kinase
MKLIRKILFPISLVYGGIAALRNYLYSSGRWERRSYDLPIICVGNLSTGGSGKSPMVEYLINFLHKDYRVAVLSRGYKRKTTGYLEVSTDNSSEDVGDEPLQFKQNFPDVTIAVCADRRTGIEKLKEKADLIILDDAFQHLKVKASFNILLTPFDDLYIDDFVLPTGNLREFRSGVKRANMVIVTKCPEGVAYAKLQEVQFRLHLNPEQKLYFSKIGYDKLMHSATESLPLSYLKNKSFTLVTGIANPKPLLDFLNRKELQFKHEKFQDHHEFSYSDIKRLKEKEIILTTEKDFMRLGPKLEKFALYYLPIKTIILKDQEDFIKETILDHLDRFSYI